MTVGCLSDSEGVSPGSAARMKDCSFTLVDQGTEFSEVQPLIQVCAELARSCTPESRDDFFPPFSADQVESLVWLLEEDPDCFHQHYAACPSHVLRECIDAVQSLIRQAMCKLSVVQPILQTRT
ncbi:unnamed protein product, partial [Staurois parvus]